MSLKIDSPGPGRPTDPDLPPEGRPERRADKFFGNNWLFFLAALVLVLVNLGLVLTSNQGEALVAINRLRSPGWDLFFKVGTHFAEPVAYLAILVLVSAFSFRKAIYLVVAGTLAGVVAGICKAIFAQARPMRWFYDNQNEIWHSLARFEDKWQSWDEVSSFPSGHTASAFALYGFLAFNARRWKTGVTLFCLSIAIMVSFSRMYLLYHFLRDVTAGAFIGLLVAMLTYYLQGKVLTGFPGLDRGWYERIVGLPPVAERVPPPK